jgi:long-chain fatty acid transport protein
MRKLSFIMAFLVVCTLALAPAAMATNGDNLIAIGPISRAMGGTGIAAPQDAISAVFSNPAAMCFGPYCPSTEVNFAGTLFMPKIDAKITTADGVVKADSEDNIYAIPAIGLSVPLSESPQNWRFGLAAYGVSGLGVDYRDTPIDYATFSPSNAPVASGTYTELQIMKFAPSLAFQPLPNLSLGLAVHVDYETLDLGDGGSTAYSFGFQPGIIWKPIDNLSLGLTYISAQKATFDHVTDFDQNGLRDDLDLEAPQQVGFGVAYHFTGIELLVEADTRWINWSDAKGYDDFDWNDQWVFAIGGQWQPIQGLFLRAGYNYANSPVDEHNGWDGSFTPAGMPNSFTNVQGNLIPTYYYETFRTIGFPAVVEQHVTLGLGYQITPTVELNVGYMYGFSNDITENGTDPQGRPVQIESNLSEQAVDFGFTWRF